MEQNTERDFENLCKLLKALYKCFIRKRVTVMTRYEECGDSINIDIALKGEEDDT